MIAVLALGSWPALAADHGLGRPATPAEIAEWDIDVRPDGQGLPKGRGSVAEGQEIYDAQCASCHGTFGESNQYMALAGGVGSLATNSPQRTVGSKLNHATTLWDYIYRAMPFAAPKTLTAGQVYALTAYVLNLNDLLPADAVLDQDSLPKVKMPNRDGYTRDHGMGRADGKPDVRNLRCMKDCEKEVRVASELPPDFTRQFYGDVSREFRGLASMNHAGAPAVAAAAPAASGMKLAQQHGCAACHGLANKIVGPGFREIAARYQDQADAAERLAAKLAAGSSGAWGAIPMPPQGHVPETDRGALIQWILAGAPE